MRASTSWLLFVWICLLGLAPAGSAWGQTPKPQWLWARSGGSATSSGWRTSWTEMGNRLEVDAAGNSYVMGGYTDSARFGTTRLDGGLPYGGSMFIAKYDPNGVLQWMRGSRNLRVFDLALDPSGTCYALVQGDTLGGATLAPAPALSLVRFGRTGRVSWQRTLSPRVAEGNLQLAIDRRGRFLVGGNLKQTTVIGTTTIPGTIIATSPRDTLWQRRVFVACFTFSGSLQWVVTSSSGPNQNHRIGALQVDAAGNAYGLIDFLGSVTLGSTTIVNSSPQIPSFQQAYFKISASGQVAWARHVAQNTTGTIMTGVAVDSAGNGYVTGAYRHQAVFGSITLTATPPQTWLSNYHYYMVKYDPAGQQEWVRDVRAATPVTGISTGGGVAVDRAGYPYQTGVISEQVLFGQDTLGVPARQGAGNNVRAFVVKYTPTGQPVWGINSGSASAEVMLGSLAFDAQAQGYLAGGFTNTLRLGPAVVTSRGGADVVVGKISRDTVGTGTIRDAYELGGRIFADTNANGQWDTGESLYTTPVVVQVQPGPFYLTATNGRFSGIVPVGTYTMTIPYVSRYQTVTTPAQTATFMVPGQVDTTNHFGIQFQVIKDLQLSLTPGRNFIPGRLASYTLTCRNVGSVPLGGTVALTLDPGLHFVGSQPTPPTTTTGQTLTWSLPTLQPQQQFFRLIDARVDSTVRWGAPLTSVAQATLPAGDVDANPADNTITSNVIARTSYDPNDKQVSDEQLTPQQAAAGPWLTYTVRFQNTGDASAMRVIIRDTLAAGLQPATIEVLAQSHPMTWRLTGAGVAQFRFDNIDLPDSTTNEPGSHGFVKFRVRADSTLVLGDSVTNTAGIYFDYNDPVITNTVVTRVEQRVVTGLPDGRAAGFTLYPNPASGAVRLSLLAAAPGPLTVRVFNTLGQEVWQEAGAVAAGSVSRNLPVRGWAPGVYTVQVRYDGRVSTQRLVVAP